MTNGGSGGFYLFLLWFGIRFFFRLIGGGSTVRASGIRTGGTITGITPALFLVVSLVKSRAFENKTGPQTKQPFGLVLFAFGTAFDWGIIHRLKEFPLVATSSTLIIVSRHGEQ